MPAGFLSLMRGPDGRRLGIVLAAILAIAAFVSGINAGSAASGSEASVICRTTGADGKNAPAPPVSSDHLLCCVAGHGAPAAGAPPERAELELRAGAHWLGRFPGATAILAFSSPLASEGPRGPPLAI